MRVGVGQFMHPTEERLRYIKQLGVDDIQLNMYETPLLADSENPLSGAEKWEYEELLHLRTRINDAGLRLNAIENVPLSFYDDVMLGREGREEQLENVKETIRNVGRVGIPVLGYHWAPNGVWRSATNRKIRGGATTTAFERSEMGDVPLSFDREYTEAELWDNYEYFIEEVLPVAEEAGVSLALHPNDPPIESIGGVPLLFRNFESFQRAMDLYETDNHGLNLCLGTWSEMHEDLFDVIEYFGSRDEILYVHYRDVEGKVPAFTETFVDEGNYDEYEVLEALRNVGFSGMMIPDHVPKLEGDEPWKHRGRAYTVGYLKGMLKSLD
ncbi:mannonate dehydratase [Halorarum halobium]|uniref:mannonate dehydratase n=1 Tax=Halorarum halobium TaxID=3075121 RepID=UPI0028AC1FC6|nr:mannonate dehydratase [Halobaculum sp. XH14]